MEIYKTPVGVLVMDGDRMVDKRLFKKDPKGIAEKLRGECREEKELKGKYPKAMEGRGRLPLEDMAEELGFCKRDEFPALVSQVNLEMARLGVREGFGRDKLIINAVRAHRSLEEQGNTMAEVLREWYSIHFPEMDGLLRENADYVAVVLEVGTRGKMTESGLAGVLGDRRYAKAVSEIAKESVGAGLDKGDMKAVREYAAIVKESITARERMRSYIEEGMEGIAPNVSAIATPYVGALLMEEAGSLEKLAGLPASTIQVLGAQKAMFRFLKTKKLPPKYGVLYIHPSVSQAPKTQKGKIARTLAGKISIAAKVDFHGGEYIGERLKSEMEKRLENL